MAVNLSPYGGVGAQFLDNSGNVLTGGKIFTYSAGTTTNQVTYTTSAGNVPHSNPIILDASGRVPSGGEIWLTDGLTYKFILRDSNDVLIATYDNVTGINSNFIAFTNQQEIQTATAGQTVFNLITTTYQPGTNSLTVFVDGVNQYGPGAQYAYVETDADTVTFVNGLHVGAEVKFTTSQLNSSGLQANAFQVSYTPPFTGSVGTNVGDKLAQTVSVMDFGAVGDGVTDDSAAIQAAIDASGSVYFPEGTYLVNTKLVPTRIVDLIGGGRGATTLNLNVNDFGIETTVSGVSIAMRDMTLVGNTGLANNAGVNVFDNGGRPFERLIINGFSRQGLKIVQSVNPIVKDIGIYNCSFLQSFAAIEINKGATACVGGHIDNVYASYSSRGLTINGCRNILITNFIAEYCAIGLESLSSDGTLQNGWFEANTVAGSFVDSNITRLNALSTTTPAQFNSTFSGATSPSFRGQPVVAPAFCHIYNADFRPVSGANTWTNCGFTTQSVSYGAIASVGSEIQVAQKGVYLVEYNCTFRDVIATAQTVSARTVFGVSTFAEIAGSYTSDSLASGGYVTVSGRALVSLAINDLVRLQFASSSASGRLEAATTATPTNATNASLLVTYVGAEVV